MTQQLTDQLKRLISENELPPKQLEIYNLIEFGKLNQIEVVEKLGAHQSDVGIQYNKAKRKVNKILNYCKLVDDLYRKKLS